MADHLDKHTDIDEELLALAKELSSLGDIDVPGVSRERTWAKVRSPIHSGEAAAQSGLLGWLRSGRYRWALAPVAAALVAALSLVAVESRGEQPRVAEGTSTSTHGTTVLPGGGVVAPTGPTAHVTTSTTKATATTKSVGGGSGELAHCVATPGGEGATQWKNGSGAARIAELPIVWQVPWGARVPHNAHCDSIGGAPGSPDPGEPEESRTRTTRGEEG